MSTVSQQFKEGISSMSMVRQQLGGDLLNVHGQAATRRDLLNVHGQAAKYPQSGSN